MSMESSYKTLKTNVCVCVTFTFSNLADAFIQSDLQMRTIEAIKPNKRAIKSTYYCAFTIMAHTIVPD